MRRFRAVIVGVVLAAVVMASMAAPVDAQWPTTCVELYDIVEAHLGNDRNVGIYQRVFGGQAEQACQDDHRDDVRGVFAWAFDTAPQAGAADTPDLAWPTDCVELNDIVEAPHLGNENNVETYQRLFRDQAERACRNDHRQDVRGVFAWAFDGDAPAPAAPGDFVAVSTSWLHTCGLRTDGAVECSGSNREGQATPPAGAFAAISAGYLHTCGVRPDGTVECWGYNRDGQATPPAGTFVAVSAGGVHTCGVRPDGEVECWGYNGEGQTTPPTGAFAAISAGNYHTCGVRPDGEVECWGYNGEGQATPPGGAFVTVSAGTRHTCGIRPDGGVECWGVEAFGQPPPGTFVAVSAGGWHTCGVRPDGTVTCWSFFDDN